MFEGVAIQFFRLSLLRPGLFDYAYLIWCFVSFISGSKMFIETRVFFFNIIRDVESE